MTTLFAAAGFLRHVAAMRPLYVAIWCVLGVAAIALVVLMRTRWGRSNTIHRCAILSLLVHVGLACAAMTVKLMVGEAGPGSGPPIHVRLVDDVSRPGPVMPLGPPPLLAYEPVEAKTQTVDEPEHEKARMEPPQLLPTPEPVKEVAKAPEPPPESKQIVDPQSNLRAAVTPPKEQAVAAAKAPEPPKTKVDADSENWTALPRAFGGDDASTTETSPVPPATSPYAHRNASERLLWAQEQGGSQATEDAVAAALKWLAAAQSPDGRWDASQFGAGVEMAVLGQDRGGVGADADAGISALALLAFLGAGNTQRDGEYRGNVASGLDFLVKNQAADGCLSGPAGLYARMYCHSMATFALAEAYAMTGDRKLEQPVRRAVEFCVRAQNSSTGGWRYRMGDTGDTSQLGWQLMALWSAERAGIQVPPQTWTGADRFLRSVRRGKQGGLAAYRPDGPASTAMTAEALYCRQMLGEVIGGYPDGVAMTEATAQLAGTLPEPSRVNLYYWYYASLALHHQQNESDQAQQAWQQWNAALTNVLLKSQVADGANIGSWNPDCIWGGYGGRVYTTAVSALCLEVYYRYVPQQDERTAARQRVRRLPQ